MWCNFQTETLPGFPVVVQFGGVADSASIAIAREDDQTFVNYLLAAGRRLDKAHTHLRQRTTCSDGMVKVAGECPSLDPNMLSREQLSTATAWGLDTGGFAQVDDTPEADR